MRSQQIVLSLGCIAFATWCSAAGGTNSLPSKVQLRQLDKNANGIIDYKEITTLPKEQSEAALDAYDINSDGEITAAELERVPRTKADLEKEAKKKQQEKQKAQQQQVKKQEKAQEAKKKPVQQKKPEPQKKPQEPKKNTTKKVDPNKPK